MSLLFCLQRARRPCSRRRIVVQPMGRLIEAHCDYPFPCVRQHRECGLGRIRNCAHGCANSAVHPVDPDAVAKLHTARATCCTIAQGLGDLAHMYSARTTRLSSQGMAGPQWWASCLCFSPSLHSSWQRLSLLPGYDYCGSAIVPGPSARALEAKPESL